MKSTWCIISVPKVLHRIKQTAFHCIFTAKTNFNKELCSSPKGRWRRIQYSPSPVLLKYGVKLKFWLLAEGFSSSYFVSIIHYHFKRHFNGTSEANSEDCFPSDFFKDKKKKQCGLKEQYALGIYPLEKEKLHFFFWFHLLSRLLVVINGDRLLFFFFWNKKWLETVLDF